MTELEKIEYTRMFVQTLSLGVNPMTGKPIPADELLHHPRVKGCLSYVCECLENMTKNADVEPDAKAEKTIPEFEFSDIPIAVNDLKARLVIAFPNTVIQKARAKYIWGWLMEQGFIEHVVVDERRKRKPTALGEEVGLAIKFWEYGKYVHHTVVFTRAAQEFIIDNIASFEEYLISQKKITVYAENHGKIWTKEEEETLIDMYQKGVAIKEIAATLKRSYKSARGRLRKLGYLDRMTTLQMEETQ